VQTDGETKMAEMVRRKLQLPSFGRALQAACDEAGIVNQKMERAVPRIDEVGDRLPIREVQSKDLRPDSTSGPLDLFGDSVTRISIADRKCHLGTGCCQHAGRLYA
jgi:hypothetical protein